MLTVALLVRLAAIGAARGHPLVAHPIMDARGYHLWAAEIARGDLIGRGVFYQEPLYPYLLGGAYALFGARPIVALVFNALLEIAGLVLLHRAARRLFGATAALLALALAAAYGLFLFDVIQVGKSSLDLLLVSALLLVVVRADRGNEPRDGSRWLVAGLVLGLGVLNRGNFLLVAPFVAGLAAFRSPGRRASAAALVAAGAALAILPVTVRNALVGRDFVLTTAHGGFNLYLGNNERADGASKRVPLVRENPEYEPDDARVVASRAEGRALRQSEVSAWWARRALAWIAAHPADAARLTLRKLRLLAAAYELPDSVDLRFVRTSVPFLALPWVSYGLLLPLGLLGVTLAAFTRRPISPLPLLLVAVTLSLLPFYVFARYRLPLVPLLIPPAGFALATLARGARSRAPAALAGLLIIPGMALTEIPPSGVDRSFAVSEANLANVLAEEGRLADALAASERALAARPDYLNARLARAGLLRRLGRAADAETELRTILAADPQEWYARYDLGRILLDRGDAAGAAREFTEGTRVWPAEAQLHFALGVALRRDGRAAEAIDAFRAAVAADSALDEGRWNLALLSIEAGDTTGARAALEELRARRPEDPRVADALRRIEAH